MSVITLTTRQEFEENVLQSDKVVLVDFWAEWCPPCRAMSPILHKTADVMEGEVVIAKVNVEASPDNQQLAMEYQIQSIPNMKVFKKGAVVDEAIGMYPQAALEVLLKKHL